jgi:hypothetical protein
LWWYDLVGLCHGKLTSTPAGYGWATAARPGGFGRCYTGNGSAGYVSLGSAARLNLGASDITLSCWLNTTTTLSQCVLGGYQSSSPYSGYGLNIGNGAAGKLNYWNGANVSWATDTGAAVNTGQWVHCAVASSNPGGTLTTNFYTNGRLNSTITGVTAGQCSAYSGSRNLGATAGPAGYLGGSLDDVSIWSRALSAAEVRQLYLDSLAGYPETLIRRRPRTPRAPMPAPGSTSAITFILTQINGV